MIAVALTAAYDGAPLSAYEKLTFEIHSDQDADLVITVAGEEFIKPLAPETATFWIGVHRHLLPEGEHTIHCTVRAYDGATLWRGESRLQIPPRNGLAERVRASLQARQIPVLFAGPLDTSFYDYADSHLRPWFDRPDATDHIQARLQAGEIDFEQARRLDGLIADGFFVMPKLVDEAHLESLRADVDKAAADGFDGYEWGTSQRMHHLHRHSDALAKLWLHPTILANLGLVFEAAARPCQTLTFIFGSQQGAHQDTIHLTPFPAGYMMGVWVALEDVKPGSGELFYYPGSHRTPRLYAHHAGWPGLFNGVKEPPGTPSFARLAQNAHRGFERLAVDYERVDYLPKAGDVLFWHENLIQGGAPRIHPDQTRKSVAMHYFADGCLAFYDSWGEPATVAAPA